MKKVQVIKVALLSAAFAVLMAVPAWAEPTAAESARDDILAEATPLFTLLVGVVVSLFALGIVITLARKVAAMIASRFSRS